MAMTGLAICITKNGVEFLYFQPQFSQQLRRQCDRCLAVSRHADIERIGVDAD